MSAGGRRESTPPAPPFGRLQAGWQLGLSFHRGYAPLLGTFGGLAW